MSSTLEKIRTCKHSLSARMGNFSACVSCGALREIKAGRAVWSVPLLVQELLSAKH